MSKQSGLGMRCYVGGYNLSGDVGSIQQIGGGPAVLDFTDITELAFERQGGLLGGTINWTSYFNPARAHPVLSALPTADTLVTVSTSATLGDSAASMQAKQIGYDGSRGQDGSFTFALNSMSESYPLEWGNQLTAGERTDTTGTNGTGVDGTASSAFGASFYLHVTAFTGTSVTVKIQDSADNSSWADLTAGGFTAATAIGWQRITTANNATVRRYLRVVSSGTFSSATFAVNAVRNTVAGVSF